LQLKFPDYPRDRQLLDSVWLPEQRALAVAGVHGIYLFGDAAPTRALEFKEAPTGVRIGTYVTYVVGPSGILFYRTAGWGLVGKWRPSPEQQTLQEALVAATKRDNVSAQSILEWAPVGSNYSVITDWNHEFVMWSLSPSVNETGDVRIEAGKTRAPIPKADWVSVRRTTSEPALLWINTGNYREETPNTVSELDLQTGQYTQRYRPCNGEWPKRVAEVATAFNLHDNTYVIFRDWSDSTRDDMKTTFDIAKWPKGGGNCLSWMRVTASDRQFEDRAEVDFSRDGHALLRLQWWIKRPSTGAFDGGRDEIVQGVQYVDVETGKVLATMEAADDVRLFPRVEIDSELKAKIVRDDFFTILYRDVAARGFDYWSGVTTEKLPAVLDPSKRLETVAQPNLTTSAPPRPGLRNAGELH
jgi:hypothetical protein